MRKKTIYFSFKMIKSDYVAMSQYRDQYSSKRQWHSSPLKIGYP